MANDRLILKCRNCGDTMTFAKYYPTLGHGIWSPEKLDTWVSQHMMCSPRFGGIDLGGDRCFDIHTENTLYGEEK